MNNFDVWQVRSLFSKVDTEAYRFLDFEKWWGGFFKLDRQEIHFITSSLFVGNELEKNLVDVRGRFLQYHAAR